jgi:hypothetical protein
MFNEIRIKKIIINSTVIILVLIVVFTLIFLVSGCRSYDNKLDIAYFFKTEPEKAVLDFLYSISNHDADYIYSNLLPENDRRNISREKFTEELSNIFSNVKEIEINRIVYLGYENEMSRVVVEFDVIYTDGSLSHYKKYFILTYENNKWKILFDRTFI